MAWGLGILAMDVIAKNATGFVSVSQLAADVPGCLRFVSISAVPALIVGRWAGSVCGQRKFAQVLLSLMV